MRKIIGFLLLSVVLFSCDDEMLIPKPPSYLRVEMPERKYDMYQDSCGFSFEKSAHYTIGIVERFQEPCHKKMDLGRLNGTMYIRYWDVDQPLSFYVNGANNEVDRHKIKSDNIESENKLFPEKKVYGTFFELQGDVATPFQFYLTDSTDRFLYCEVLFNSSPNYDSLKPSLEYLREDLNHLINTFEWK